MKIKLNRSKMEGLLHLITNLLDAEPNNKAEKILYCLVNQIRIKIRNRLDQVNYKNTYQITLSEHEALAFELWFENLPFHHVLPHYEYNIARQICGEIDKTYGTNLNNR